MKAEGLRLRAARPADVPRLHAIAQAAYEIYIPLIGRRPAPMDEDFAASVASGGVIVVEREGDVAGYASTKPQGDALLLESVAVAPDHGGGGLGRALIAQVEAAARRAGFRAVVLYTNAAMRGNLALYDRLGYRRTGQRTEAGFERVYFRKDLA